MVSPDSIVAAHGELVDLVRVTAPLFADDSFDEANSRIETVRIPAVVSMPSEKALRAFQGRNRIPTLCMTVSSGVDVRSDRPGRPDHVRRGGILYQVEEVRNDTHPFAQLRKKTVYLAQLPGR